MYFMDFDIVDYGFLNCDHIGTDYKGYSTVLEIGAGGEMWFAATNGVNSNFSVLTYRQ